MRGVLNISGHEVAPGIRRSTENALGTPIEVQELSRNLALDNLVDDLESPLDSAQISQA